MTTHGDRPLPDPAAFAARLARVRQVATALSAAFPDSGTGWDPGGAVQVRVSRTGGVAIATVARDWERRVGAHGLGGAVIAAAVAAVATSWGDADRRLAAEPAWLRRDDPLPDVGIPALPPPSPSAVDPSAVDGAALAEELLAAGRALRPPPTPPATVTGSAANGAVTVDLGPAGLTGCEVDAGWARGRSALVVSEALRKALAAAEAERATGAATTGEPPTARVDAALARALELLSAGAADRQEDRAR